MNARGHTKSVPWMYAIGPKNPLVKLNESDLTESTTCVHSWFRVGVTACIHGTRLMWPREVTARSWCDCVHSWYGVDAIWYAAGQSHSMWFLCTLYCTLHRRIHLADFMLVLARKNQQIHWFFLLIFWWRPYKMR